MGNATQAEGDGFQKLIDHMNTKGLTIDSLATDGDSESFDLAKKAFPAVVHQRDHNHYMKGVIKDLADFVKLDPVLKDISEPLKKHFQYGLKKYGPRFDEEGFKTHLLAFIDHVTNSDHSFCSHDKEATITQRLDPSADTDAVELLRYFLSSFLLDVKQLVHPFSTNGLEALNGNNLFPSHYYIT